MPDGLLRVESVLKEYKLISWQLESIVTTEVANDIFERMREVQQDKSNEWHMSFNSTFLSIEKNKINCSDLYDENDFIEIKLDLFKAVLKGWMLFVEESKNKKNYRKTVSF